MEYELQRFDKGIHFIMLDKKTVQRLTAGGNKRAVCRINDAIEFHCAVIPRKEMGHYVSIGMPVCKKLGIRKGDKVKATFSIDTAKYQFEMPEELQEVLDTDATADKVFHSLTAGNQRGLIQLVLLVKSPQKRVERALHIAEKIKNGVSAPQLVMKR
jgi:hypothetical protein